MKFFALLSLLLLPLSAMAGTLADAVLDEMNLARTEPQRYARILEKRMGDSPKYARDVREAIRFLERTKPLPPLEMSSGISLAAQMHVLDAGPRGGRGHRGRGGSSPWSRMERFGRWSGSAAENIHYGSQEARRIVCALIVDHGVRSRGHRKNIFNRTFRYTGIACGPHSTYGAMCVMDFAGSFVDHSSRAIAAR